MEGAGEGLAAQSAGVTNTYGDGKSNTITHAYGGVINKGKSKKKKGK
jgi:hypothetical protein